MNVKFYELSFALKLFALISPWRVFGFEGFKFSKFLKFIKESFNQRLKDDEL